MTSAPHAPFRIGTALVDPARNRVVTPAGEQGLEPKIMAVLCLMAAHPGEVLSRDILIDRVWGVEYGGDESLTRAISLLRKALGDAKAIETISKRGYRLSAPVTSADAEPQSLPAAPVVKPSVRPLGLAVAAVMTTIAVAFGIHALTAPKAADTLTVLVEPVSAPPADADLARRMGDGLAGEISNQSLSKVKSTSSSKFSDTPLTYFVKSDLRADGDRLKVVVQLIDAHTGMHLWTQTYDRPLNSADDLITVIAAEIQLPLLKAAKADLLARPIDSLKPWELNLLVTWVPGTEEIPGPPSESSFTLQNRALAIDPNYAPAHATFAEMAAYHALFDPPSDMPAARQRAQMHAEKALQLGGYDPEVLYHVATYYRFAGDRQRATALLKRVLTLQPSNLTAQADLYFVSAACQSDTSAATASLQTLDARLSAANPARWVILSHLADLALSQGDFARAADYARQSHDITGSTWSSITLAAAETGLHRNDAQAFAHEHDAEWTHLGYGWFAASSVPRLCLDGPRTAAVQSYFAALTKTSE